MELVIAATIIFLCITQIISTLILMFAISQMYQLPIVPPFQNVVRKVTHPKGKDTFTPQTNIPIEQFRPSKKDRLGVEFVEDKFDAEEN